MAALTTRTLATVRMKATESVRRMRGRRDQVDQSRRQKPIQAVTPARAEMGMWATKAEPAVRKSIIKAAWERLEMRVEPPQRTLARERAGMPTLKGAPKRPQIRLAMP